MAEKRVAVDVGGTFTDVCIMDEKSGQIDIEKRPSTPDDPVVGVMNAVKAAEIDMEKMSIFSHGTTVATNALITRNLPRSALVCTSGFRDVVEIRRANKEDLWDTYNDVAPPYVPRRDRLTVDERLDSRGQVVTPLNEEQAYNVANILKKRDIKAVAICFINSYVNGAHEQRMAEIIREVMPEVPVSLSSEVMPEIFEHERFSTTMVNAAVSPVVVNYVKRLEDELIAGGYSRELLLLHSGGGVMTAANVSDFPARLAGSGITAGAIASRFIGNLCGYPNSIGFDMGGTSTDVSLTFQGKIRVTKDWHIEFGYPIRFPSVEVLTIGAGGGSLAWKDEGGSLRNGPQSAGAAPGPACYGQGGTEATNTDANVVLGRLGSSLAGGSVQLDPQRAENAIQSNVADEFNLELHEAAEAVVSVANANMANAVRNLSIGRGHDPREFALVAFGGAGALHGAEVAKELSIPTVIVPPNPGVTSAMGCLLIDVQHDISESFIAEAADVKIEDLQEAFARITTEAEDRLRNENIAPENWIFERSIEMMYQGQWRALSIPVPSNFKSVDELIQIFHDEHERAYSFRRDSTPVTIFRVELKAIGTVPKAELAKYPVKDHVPEPDSTRDVWFGGKSFSASIFERDNLSSGASITGPAVVEQFDSTVVVPVGMSATVDQYRNIIIKVAG